MLQLVLDVRAQLLLADINFKKARVVGDRTCQSRRQGLQEEEKVSASFVRVSRIYSISTIVYFTGGRERKRNTYLVARGARLESYKLAAATGLVLAGVRERERLVHRRIRTG